VACHLLIVTTENAVTVTEAFSTSDTFFTGWMPDKADWWYTIEIEKWRSVGLKHC